MKIEDLYTSILQKVISTTEIKEENILKSNKESCVDARYLLIHFLSQYLTDDEISNVTGIVRQSVNRIRNNFPNRMNKWSLKENLKEIGSQLAPK